MQEKEYDQELKNMQDSIKRFVPLFDDIRLSPDHEIGKAFDATRKDLPANGADVIDQIREFDITRTSIRFMEAIYDPRRHLAYRYNNKKGVALIDSSFIDNVYLVLSLMTRIYVEQFRTASHIYITDQTFWALCNENRNKIKDLSEILDYHASSCCASIFDVAYEKMYLLKTLDIDIKMGYRLGKVFGLGDDSYVDYIRDKVA